jgi:hypothetical protein
MTRKKNLELPDVSVQPRLSNPDNFTLLIEHDMLNIQG